MKLITDPVHFSNLKLFAKSPAHYRDSIGAETDEAAFRLGRATHALLLGVQPGGKWDVYEGGRRAGKAWEAWRDERPDTDIYIPSEMALARAMAKAVAADPHASDLLSGEFEIPITWKDESGRLCETRGRDVLNRNRRYIVDVKTARTAHPGRFTREALGLGYHAQGALYIDAAKSLGVDVQDVYIVAVEKRRPHPVTVLRFTARALLEGRKLIRSWMEQLLVCEAANAWPAYAQSIVDLDVAEENELIFDEEEAA
jgi:hypothetical protein